MNHCKPYKEQLVEHQKRLEEIRRNNELIRKFPSKEKLQLHDLIHRKMNKIMQDCSDAFEEHCSKSLHVLPDDWEHGPEAY